MNLNTYNDPDYQKKMAECIEQYEIIDALTERAEKAEAEVERLRALCEKAPALVRQAIAERQPGYIADHYAGLFRRLWDAAGCGRGEINNV